MAPHLKRKYLLQKKIYQTAILIFVSLTGQSSLSAERNTVRIGNFLDYIAPRPPYRWNENCVKGNQVIGTGSHLLTKIFNDIGYNIDWVIGNTTIESTPQQFEKKYQQLKSGELDFLITAQNPHHKQDTIDIPFSHHRNSIITQAGRPIYNGNPKSLKNYRGGLTSPPNTNSPAHQYFIDRDMAIKIYDKEYSALEALLAGEIDYILSDYYIAKIWAHDNQANKQLKFDDISEIPARTIYLAIFKDNPNSQLADELNSIISRYKDEGFIDYLKQFYLTRWEENPCI